MAISIHHNKKSYKSYSLLKMLNKPDTTDKISEIAQQFQLLVRKNEQNVFTLQAVLPPV